MTSFDKPDCGCQVRAVREGSALPNSPKVSLIRHTQSVSFSLPGNNNENYVTCPTRATISGQRLDEGGSASYSWKHRGEWLTIGAGYSGPPTCPLPDSEEEFITEHYWGYSTQRDGGTVEYRVEHPQWQVWPATEYTAEGDFAAFYGSEFAGALAQIPTSVFVADGSRNQLADVGGPVKCAAKGTLPSFFHFIPIGHD